MIETIKQRIKGNKQLRPFAYFFWILMRRWGDDECPVKASAMAFFGLLSIFPIILAAVSILATVMAGNVETLEAFGKFVTQLFPGQAAGNVSTAVEDAVVHIAEGPNATSLGIVALFSLLWSGRAYFTTLAAVLNRIWPQAKPRSFLGQQLTLWGTFAAGGILAVLSMISTFALSTAKSVLSSPPLWLLERLPLMSTLSLLLSWIFAFLMFWFIYSFLPNVEKKQGKLIIGAALFAAFAWELAKFVFSNAVGKILSYEATYGSIAGVIVTMVWIYFASMILLLGAEGAAAWDETRRTLRDMD